MKTKRILAVEDDPGYQELITMILSKEFDLTMCASVEEALPKLDSGVYHLIITDILLLGQTGFEVMSRVRHTDKLKGCPVVFCSSQFDETTKQKALDMGAAGFLAKPFQPDALISLARHILA